MGIASAVVRLVTYESERGPRAGRAARRRRDRRVGRDRRRGRHGPRAARRRPARRARRGRRAGDAAGELRLLAPVPDPQKIIGIGLNYADHAAEARLEPPASPTFFAKFANALRADGDTVALPAASEKVDYEAEVAFVVGRRAKDVAEADAIDHLAGYTLLNDLSARDLQFATPQWMPGKVFDGAAPCGPAIVTPDEAGAHDAIGIALDLNGERMQEDTHRGADLLDPAARRPPLDA